jgi:hypothetical protein
MTTTDASIAGVHGAVSSMSSCQIAGSAQWLDDVQALAALQSATGLGPLDCVRFD